ncbi:MAG: hypothetical protein HC937_03390 [Aquincola sp.]|nr:hypothetical protein [Aquincola sp.]
MKAAAAMLVPVIRSLEPDMTPDVISPGWNIDSSVAMTTSGPSGRQLACAL